MSKVSVRGFVFMHARSWLPQAQSLDSKVSAHTKLLRVLLVLLFLFFFPESKIQADVTPVYLQYTLCHGISSDTVPKPLSAVQERKDLQHKSVPCSCEKGSLLQDNSLGVYHGIET